MDPDEAQRRREECERKARRGEMDPRLEFTFQLLIDATQLPRHQLMDYIFEGDMVVYSLCAYPIKYARLHNFFALQLDEINQLFLPNMKNKLLWFYQEVDEPDPPPVVDANKPGPSRTGMASSSSKTPQGKGLFILHPANADSLHPFSFLGGASPSGLPPPKHKKLFLTDGWTCAFTGVCIYIFRVNTSKQLPEEGFQKDL